MINPNNRELKQPELLNNKWETRDPMEAIGEVARELRSHSEKYQPQSIVGTELELEALNKLMETKAANWEYFKKTHVAALSQPDPTPNQSKPIVNSVIEAVNHPSHYNQGDIEAIDAIAAAGFADGFCLGNCMKYLWRYKHKNGEEDLAKAQFYLNWYIDYLQKKKTTK